MEQAFSRVATLDGDGLDAALRRAAVTLGAHAFLEDVVGPLLHRVGVAWARGGAGDGGGAPLHDGHRARPDVARRAVRGRSRKPPHGGGHAFRRAPRAGCEVGRRRRRSWRGGT
ncbi:MAG: hypothetical protein MZV65_17205 [Chromatiales bacterium]|nr:hypothetical protein [Chromatiales bacterium]